MTYTNLKIHRHYDNNIDVVEHDCNYLATGNVSLADDSIDDCYINFEFEAIIKMDYENDIDDIELEIMLARRHAWRRGWPIRRWTTVGANQFVRIKIINRIFAYAFDA